MTNGPAAATRRHSWQSFIAWLIGIVGIAVSFFTASEWHVTLRAALLIFFSAVTGFALWWSHRQPDSRSLTLRSDLWSFVATVQLQKWSVPADSPFLGFLAGWLRQLVKELNTPERGRWRLWQRSSFTIDADYWQHCLERLRDDDVIWAVADGSDADFIDPKLAPPSPKVKERIYLLPWLTFFDEDKLKEYIDLFQGHSRPGVRTFIGHVPCGLTEAELDLLVPFPRSDVPEELKRSIGWNIFLLGGHVMGAFIHAENKKVPVGEKGRRLLYVARNKSLSGYLEARYGRLRGYCVEFHSTSAAQDVRASWIEQHHIGDWIWEQQPVERRGESYTRPYDAHIRVWVPRYSRLIQACADQVKFEVLQRFREMDRLNIDEVRVLEVGFGTGALSVQILTWIQEINAPIYAVDRRNSRAVKLRVSYAGVDTVADQWRQGDLQPPFYKAKFWAGVRDLGMKEFDVICASLVLHDLITELRQHNEISRVEAFKQLMAQVRQFLRPGGRVIFADVFTGGDGAKQQWWRSQMREAGLPAASIEPFFQSNYDMIDTLTEEEVSHWADALRVSHLFTSPYEQGEPGSVQSPFKILTITFSESGSGEPAPAVQRPG